MAVNGSNLLFPVIMRDVSQGNMIEQALNTSRRQLTALVDQVPACIAMLDRNLNYIATSRCWLAEYGRGAVDLTGLNHYDVIPDIKEEWKDINLRALEGVAAVKNQDIWVRGDGSRTWLRWAVHPWFNEAGGVGGIIIFAENVTHHKLTETALQASENDLVRAQAVGNIGSWRLDVRRNELTWSAESHRIFGVADGTHLSYETFLSCVHPDDRDYVDRMWQDCLAGKPYDIEHRLLIDGKVKWVREKAELEFDSEGVLLGGFGITQNITEKRLVENQLKEANDQLAEVANARAAHLRELSGELTRAEQQERDRFYELLHDQVQPLLVATRLLLSGLSERTAQEDMLRVVEEAKEHVSMVIHAARTLSVELSPPLIRERGLLPALESLCRWVRSNYGLDVQMVCTPDAEPASMTIRLMCFNAVRELLMNVVKYAGTRQAVLDLRQEPHNTLRIMVRDNGAGFDPSVEHFGSGLSNFNRRLEMVGGGLSIESSPGVGTTAILLAPLDMRNAELNASLHRQTRHHEAVRYNDPDMTDAANPNNQTPDQSI